MRGIKLSHGVSFVEWDGVTVRVNTDGSCELSPVLLPSLEWDLRTEPPETWTYITHADMDSFSEDTRRQIEHIAAEFHRLMGE